ncbi:Rho GTPase activation protein [Phascolomyces articulosus]|uniref:Rho GTPase activation protein n=1 Tax=Phascolomyces articulosus TaxID=60185 RepID=A0AAD5JYU8_9FUNG|nr:Rho GTPase activation protein [Phascolomyces articulosus]
MSTFDIPTVLSPTQKTILSAWWKKVTVANRKGNEMDYTESSSEKRVFGLPLSESIKYAHSSISYADDGKSGQRCYGIIPTIIAKCGSFLKEEGLMIEGIFRMSGSAKRISSLQQMFDESEDYGAKFNWEGGYTVHDAANVMRRFLNHLPEPVITLDYYRPFKDAMFDEYPNIEAKIQAFQHLIDELPLVHQYLLLYIMDMLGLFSLTSDETRMDVSALAAVFAPGVLSHPDDELNPAGYKESQRVLEFLIEHQDKFAVPRSCIPANQSLIPRHTLAPKETESTPLRRRSSAKSEKKTELTRITQDLQDHSLGGVSEPKLTRSATQSIPKGGKRLGIPFNNNTTISLPSTDDIVAATATQLKRSKTVPSKRQKDSNHDAAVQQGKTNGGYGKRKDGMVYF